MFIAVIGDQNLNIGRQIYFFLTFANFKLKNLHKYEKELEVARLDSHLTKLRPVIKTKNTDYHIIFPNNKFIKCLQSFFFLFNRT